MDQCAVHKMLPCKTRPGDGGEQYDKRSMFIYVCACYIVKSAATIDIE